MNLHVTPLWVTTDLYWHGLTLQRTVLAPTLFWLQICHKRGNENFSFPLADFPLLTEGWLMCCIRKRSMPKCRSCRKDSSGAVKSVQPGYTVPIACKQLGCHLQWSQVSEVRTFLLLRNMTKQKAASQESKDALTELWWPTPTQPAAPSPSPSCDSGTCTAASRTTNRDYSLLQQLFRGASNTWLKHFLTGVLEITPLSDKVSIVVIVFKNSQWPPSQELCMKQRVWTLIYCWSATIN